MTDRHQWIVMVAYGLTDAEAAATEGGVQQRLDAEHRLSVDGPACANCEQPWAPELAAQRCPAPWYEMRSREEARVTQA